jgi:hypothetical protein
MRRLWTELDARYPGPSSGPFLALRSGSSSAAKPIHCFPPLYGWHRSWLAAGFPGHGAPWGPCMAPYADRQVRNSDRCAPLLLAPRTRNNTTLSEVGGIVRRSGRHSYSSNIRWVISVFGFSLSLESHSRTFEEARVGPPFVLLPRRCLEPPAGPAELSGLALGPPFASRSPV